MSDAPSIYKPEQVYSWFFFINLRETRDVQLISIINEITRRYNGEDENSRILLINEIRQLHIPQFLHFSQFRSTNKIKIVNFNLK